MGFKWSPWIGLSRSRSLLLAGAVGRTGDVTAGTDPAAASTLAFRSFIIYGHLCRRPTAAEYRWPWYGVGPVGVGSPREGPWTPLPRRARLIANRHESTDPRSRRAGRAVVVALTINKLFLGVG